MIIRFFLTMGMYVVLARWMYAEAVTAVPEVQPAIDTALQTISIPTHDNWDKEKINAVLTKVEGMIPWGDEGNHFRGKVAEQFAKVTERGGYQW